MNSFNIVYEQHGKYSAIVYPISYQNPIEDIQLISRELMNHLPAGSYVLFDLLLSNGDNFNRFAEVIFNGSEISRKEIKVATIPISLIQSLDSYYHGRIKELNKSVLSNKEKYKYATTK